jgi:hypothetical protein
MIDVEPIIKSELSRLVAPTLAAPDWEDVAERARVLKRAGVVAAGGSRRGERKRPRRVQLLVVVGVVLALLAAAPAISGVGYGRVIDWLSGKPPQSVVNGLTRLDQGAPAGMAQHPIVGKTGLVYDRQTPYGRVRIWLTPARGGDGFCESFETPGATGRTGSLSGTCFPAAMQHPIEAEETTPGIAGVSVSYLDGRLSPSIVRLELRYVDGETDDVPIQGGFFVATVDPARTNRLSDRPQELVGYDSSGKIAGTSKLDFYGRGFPTEAIAPPVAETDQEHPLINIELPAGSPATLYESPSRAGGDCDRIEAAGTTWSWTCADPTELTSTLRFAVNRVADGAQVATILYGVVEPGVSLEFQYEDGTNEQVALTNQRFLVALPSESSQPGHRLSAIVASKDGQVTLRVPMATKDDAFYASGADRPPARPQVYIYNPTNLPVVAQLQLTGSHGEQLAFLVRRETATHWYEVLTVDGKAVVGSNLQWFPGGHDAIIGSGWTPLAPPQVDVPKPLSLFMEDIREPAVAAQVVYADGTTKPLEIAKPSEPVGGGISGWFVYELSDSERAKQPERFEALNARGAVVGSAAVPKGA